MTTPTAPAAQLPVVSPAAQLPAARPGRLPVPFDIDAAIREVWVRAEAEHARSWQAQPGPSAAGGCLRQVGYMYAGVPPSDPRELASPAATLGTWVHDRFLPLLQDVLGGDIEFEVTADPGGVAVRGHGDWHGRGVALDLKTKASSTLSRIRSRGASRQQLWQVHLYAKGLLDRGVRVDFVLVVFLARDTADHHAVWYRYDPEITAEALAWFRRARDTRNPDELSRGGRGPGLSRMCDSCAWLSRCWPNGQTSVIDEAPRRDRAVESALALYEDARQRELEAKADKEFAAAMVAGERRGVYGDFELRFQSSGRRLDQAAAKARLLALGEEPPMMEATWSPRVTRVKGDDGDQ